MEVSKWDEILQELVMLNEVKHLVLFTGGFCFPRTRFFVALLLKNDIG